MKAILRSKFIVINSYNNKEIPQITVHLKEPEKEKQINPIINRRKEPINIRAELKHLFHE